MGKSVTWPFCCKEPLRLYPRTPVRPMRQRLTHQPPSAPPSQALLERYDGRVPRYTSYPPAPLWSEIVTNEVYAKALAECSSRPDPFGVYVHVPFCQQRCWYCGCNVTIQPDETAADPFLDRLEKEAAEVVRHFGRARSLDWLHLGGGTPNYLDTHRFSRLMSIIRSHFDCSPDAELSAELDPRVATTAQVSEIASHGFNRLSFGVQDTDPDVGEAVGRRMDPSHIADIVAAARNSGVRGVNLDLIYGLPLQTEASIRSTVDTIAEIGPDRIAMYGYAHVPWIRPQQRRLERHGLPNPSERVALFMAAWSQFADHGYVPIGMDHFARPTDPLVVAERAGRLNRTFQGYTPRPDTDLIGLGPSAIGRLVTTKRPMFIQNATSEKVYRRDEGFSVVRGHVVNPDESVRGAAIREVLCHMTLTDPNLWRDFPAARTRLAPFAADGLVELQENGVSVTASGRLFLRQIAACFDVPPEESEPRYSQAI
ncbi:MAG: oxygen-independent coproporphyrinogen-3 oxidase [Myxococcota bacterium]